MNRPSRAERPATFGVEALFAGYSETPVLHDVTWAVPAGEVSAVVGGDGAGKTTLLRTLAGALSPTSGRVQRPDVHAIGYAPAGPGCYTDLSIDENLRFVAAAYGIGSRALAARADLLLHATGLAASRDRLAGRLSGGMRRKLAFALAILHEPALLVLDEPTTGVDPVSRVDLWRLVARAAVAGTAVALSTTYLDEAERAASVLVLHEGRVLVSGAPADIVRDIGGHVVESAAPVDRARAWRRGALWREWRAGRPRPGATVVEPGLEDAVIVAALREAARVPSS